jgi:simple sugar transport system substrate-binding protein
MRKARVIQLGAAAAAVLATACGSTSTSTGSGGQSSNVNLTGGCKFTFAMITHGDTGSFWSVVKKGSEQAAKDLGCTVTWYGSDSGSGPNDQAEGQQIDTAISQGVDGLAVSEHADFSSQLAAAKSKNIPIVLLNAGCDDATIAKVGAITCVGQPESLAGKKAGARLASEGVKHALCILHQSGQNLKDRCDGLEQGLGGTVDRLDVSTTGTSNISGTQTAIQTYLQSHSGIDAVVTLNADIATGGAEPAIAAGAPSAKLVTFDFNARVITDVQSNKIDFAIDQQQYLQGYMPVVILYLNKINANTLGGGTTVPSGPFLIDSKNASQIATLVGQGTR